MLVSNDYAADFNKSSFINSSQFAIVKTIGGNYIDKLTSLQQTSDGWDIIGGNSDSPNHDKTEASVEGFADY